MSGLAQAVNDALHSPLAHRHDTQDSSATVKPPPQPPHRLHFADSNELHTTSRSISSSHLSDADDYSRLRSEYTSKSLSRLSALRPGPDTPSTRTGPPRSLSFAYTPASPPLATPVGPYDRTLEHDPDVNILDDVDLPFSNDSDFRGALEYPATQDRKGKKRERDKNSADDTWNIMKWFHESPKEEKAGMEFPKPDTNAKSDGEAEMKEHPPPKRPSGPHSDSEKPSSSFYRSKGRKSTHESDPQPNANTKASAIRRAFSLPHSRSSTEENRESVSPGSAKWGKLRSMLPQIVHPGEPILPGPSAVTSQAVNITDELIAGGLSTLMLRLWLERDEKDHRRIPVLLHRLRIRVSDSLHPMQGHRSVFRIECEYANGAARWVVYRELRDFLSLHAHYTVSNVYNRNVERMPEFPKTSLPYFKFLKKEGKEKGDNVGRADFARLQREALENYLIDLIRAVMFHPSSNRLSGFLEISALSIALAQSGGAQYKGGFLRIEASGSAGGGFGRKSAGWREKKESRWCAVRESYLVALEEPGELTVWDVFLLDSDFRIERPTRYYRQGFGNLLHSERTEQERHDHSRHGADVSAENGSAHHHHHSHLHTPHVKLTAPDSDQRSMISSIKSRVSKISKIFHLEPASPRSKKSRQGRHSHEVETDADPDTDTYSSSESSEPSHPPTPMLDPSTNTNPLERENARDHGHEQTGLDLDAKKKEIKSKRAASAKKRVAGDVSKHTFYIVNSQMRLRLSARNERQMLQFITALERTAATSHYTGSNRFDSFAPIRLNVAAQWLVDGRDYFWNLSRAITLAKESIYIHDWWLSPEVQLRRPGKPRYRLDNLLERKAKEGVKIYIILYQEVSNRTTPTDSNYSKQRLVNLHPNVMVQRSPSHFQTGTFYWAHHEKMCVIDQTIAFMGGLDLCFGRWDTPQHVLTDDIDEMEGSEEIWPGKDYSNPRISDFTNLPKFEEDMYDRTKVPRMPWHDVAMQVVGQPARDLARHFVQRWNYLLRIKNHSRVMPFLLPPPEFRPGELTQLGLTGTCELQICRSAGPWSLGTPTKIEHSIQNAYLKAIQMSEHFVYIENQFFITSTVVNDVRVENNIGDAIVHRVIRAHRDGTPWKCCIVIPLLPGFTFPVDHSDASAIRIILECQNRTISRGPHSIFGRLIKEGIDPDQYVSVFSLRNWAKMRGDVLTTEQVYIHAKTCIVDDRLAIIGSANINERSQKGDRDSELAAVIRDTDLIDSTMAGRPFQVGRFAHTLRVRLMREHLGIDVDAIDEDDLMANEPAHTEFEQEAWDPDREQVHGQESGVTHVSTSKQKTPVGQLASAAADSLEQAAHAGAESTNAKVASVLQAVGLVSKSMSQSTGDEIVQGSSAKGDEEHSDLSSSLAPTLEEKTVAGQTPKGSISEKNTSREGHDAPSNASTSKSVYSSNGQSRAPDVVSTGASANASGSIVESESHKGDAEEDEKAIPSARSRLRSMLGHNSTRRHAWAVPTKRPKVEPEDFEDPISNAFWSNIWVASAVHNTEIYRKVFRAIPDDMVTTWKQYKEFVAYHERLNKPTRDNPPEPVARIPSESGDEMTPQGSHLANGTDAASEVSREGEQIIQSPPASSTFAPTTPTPSEDNPQQYQPKPRKPAKGSEPFEKWERDEMEKLLNELNGHLVLFPTRFLEGEDHANNFLFNADRLLPLPIYD